MYKPTKVQIGITLYFRLPLHITLPRMDFFFYFSLSPTYHNNYTPDMINW